MMDYTQCDFTPIIGAEVEIEIRHPTNHIVGRFLCREKWEDGYGGKDALCVLLKEWDGDYIEEANLGGFHDVVASIKATMKPRDMNPEQLHRLAEEIATEHYGNRYESIRGIYHYFDEDGELNDISVDARCHLPNGGAFVIDPNEPVDITHWIKENKQ